MYRLSIVSNTGWMRPSCVHRTSTPRTYHCWRLFCWSGVRPLFPPFLTRPPPSQPSGGSGGNGGCGGIGWSVVGSDGDDGGG